MRVSSAQEAINGRSNDTIISPLRLNQVLKRTVMTEVSAITATLTSSQDLTTKDETKVILTNFTSSGDGLRLAGGDIVIGKDITKVLVSAECYFSGDLVDGDRININIYKNFGKDDQIQLTTSQDVVTSTLGSVTSSGIVVDVKKDDTITLVARNRTSGKGNIYPTGTNLTVKEIVKSVAGKPTGGTSDQPTTTANYNELTNKPSINGVTLIGNKSLDNLGIQPKGDYLISVPSEYVTETELNEKGYITSSALGDYVTTNTEQDVTGAKTFKNVMKIQNGQGTGSLWIGGDVNANTLTNNKRRLARIVVPSFSDITKGATLLGFDSSGDSDLHITNKGSDVVSFGGMKKITNATSPMALAFCVAKTRGGMAASEKVYPIEMDASEARFNVPPNYNGVKLVTTDDAPTQSLTNTEIETLINSIV